MRWKTLISAQTLRFGLLASPAVLVGCPAPSDLEAQETPEVTAAVDVINALDPRVEPAGDKPGAFKIQSVNPTIGTTDGDRIALIRGSGFVPGMGVHFGDQEAKDVTFISDSMMTAVVPVHEAGTVDVTLSTRGADGEQSQTAMSNAFTFVTVPDDDGTDSDGDGLTDVEEQIIGYRIRVDFLGLGMNPAHLAKFNVNSDPLDPDTDDDGLLDSEEYFANTNPRSRDTDMDGLWDYEEAKRWLTSPISIDSDGDARAADPSTDRSTIPPVFDLFDGLELYTASELAKHPSQRTLKLNATSPTLDDTDGDGVTDFEEIDTPVRTPLLADMPQLLFEIVDDVDLRLDVEYAEEQGRTTAFETSFATGASQSKSKSQSNTVSASMSVGAEIEVSPVSLGSTSIEVTAGYEHSWGTTTESVISAERTVAQLQEKARTNTEVAASGSMTAGIRITNLGNITVQLVDLVHTVRQWQPNANADANDNNPGSYQALAALSPDLGPGLTLAPGANSGVLLAEASDLNADRVKDFLRRPDSLQVEPAAFELINDQGLNYAFIEEFTQARTARLSIDFGNGTFEEYRIATNVDRNPDSSLAGIPLTRALDLALGKGNWESGSLPLPCGGPGNLLRNESFEPPNVPSDDSVVATPDQWRTIETGLANVRVLDSELFGGDGDQWVLLNAGPGETASIYQQIGSARSNADYTYDLTADAPEGTEFVVSLWAGDPAGGTLVASETHTVGFGSPFQFGGMLQTTTHNSGAPLYFSIALEDPSQLTWLQVDGVDVQGPRQIITRIRETVTDFNAPRFWSVFLSEGVLSGPSVDTVVLRNGDTVLLSLSQDVDNDGLYAAQEQQYGTSDLAVDSDGDGISDPEEAARNYANGFCATLPGGWDVSVTRRDGSSEDYRVYSNPRLPDADNDNLNDFEERAQGSDPTLADTDGDGLNDDIDPEPLFAARILHVSESGQVNAGGLSWADAFSELGEAINVADAANNDGDASNDVSEIWVASGSYTLSNATLPNKTGLYGGFAGNETRLGQRIADARANDTRLSNTNDTPLFDVMSSSELFARVDGFILEESTNRAMRMNINTGEVTIANCFFANNTAIESGAAVHATGGDKVSLLDCVFTDNATTVRNYGGAGAVWVVGTDLFEIRGCTFVNNRLIFAGDLIDANGGGESRGGVMQLIGTHAVIEDCDFRRNSVVNVRADLAVPALDPTLQGGAIALWLNSSLDMKRCYFESNQVDQGVDALQESFSERRGGGAVYVSPYAQANVQNCVFIENRAPRFGGAICVEGSQFSKGVARIVNCSFLRNGAYVNGDPATANRWEDNFFFQTTPIALGGAVGSSGDTSMFNCVAWDNYGVTLMKAAGSFGNRDWVNWGVETQIAIDPVYESGPNTDPIGTMSARFCAVNTLGFRTVLNPTNGGLEPEAWVALDTCIAPSDPGFLNLAAGNLRLASGSPLIDAGESIVDADVLQPGFQVLPAFDFDINDRETDGDVDGTTQVDIGAFEYQAD